MLSARRCHKQALECNCIINEFKRVQNFFVWNGLVLRNTESDEHQQLDPKQPYHSRAMQ